MMRIALVLTLLLPDRLPTLIVLVGFWIPPAVAGWVAAEFLQRSTRACRSKVTFAVLATFVLGYAAAWFLFNLGRVPPYIPGASTDPTFAPPEAVRGLAVVTSAGVARQRARVRSGVSPPWADAHTRAYFAWISLTEALLLAWALGSMMMELWRFNGEKYLRTWKLN